MVNPVSRPEVRAAAIERLAEEVADAVRAYRSILFLSDFDGTVAPFVDDPDKSRAVPEVVASYTALDLLPDAKVMFVTGGDGHRTATVLERSGLRVDAAANYGSDSVSWNGGRWDISGHPDVPALKPFWDELLRSVDEQLRARAYFGHPSALVSEDTTPNAGDVAEANGLVLVEHKGTLVALHAKGSTVRPYLGRDLEEVLPVALQVAWGEWWRRILTSDVPKADQDRLENLLANVHVARNNGNVEVVVIPTTKFQAVDDLIARHDPHLLIYNADDAGDFPAIERVRRAASAGVSTFVAAVYNPPEPGKNRIGTPSSIVDSADVVFESSADLGKFWGSVITRAVALRPELSYLSEAATQLRIDYRQFGLGQASLQ
jgi:trehalose-6-phosphatase